LCPRSQQLQTPKFWKQSDPSKPINK
jgi:hypothetical protein